MNGFLHVLLFVVAEDVMGACRYLARIEKEIRVGQACRCLEQG